ncbi:MAG: glycosyltransferase [Lachnospiraceae bacterium]|nr:glycosyltransferase [Lachnospiraceae bacterium]
MPNTEIDVIIPVYRPGEELRRLLRRLTVQTIRPAHILLVNTQEELFDSECMDGIDGAQVIHITKQQFDHGGTRHMAAEKMTGEFILFMTQDAVPAHETMIEELYAPFSDKKVCAAYARQLPRAECSIIEKYTRSFNYGPESRIKTQEDLAQLGIKTFFCSNVCAMYRRSAYEELGGFERRTIFNEDMIFAAKLIQSGKAVAYCAKARVIHSHNYSSREQFHRNFDLGVSQAEHPEIFDAVKSESEGIRMVKQTAAYLIKLKKLYLLPKLCMQSAAKYAGYKLGKNYKKLPKRFIYRCTMNRAYWE